MRQYQKYKSTESKSVPFIPMHWEIGILTKFLKTIADYRGKTPRKLETSEQGGILLVTARNIKKGNIDYALSEEFVDRIEANKLLSRGKLQLGDVLFTTEAPLGEVANIDRIDIALAQRIIKFRSNPKILDNYYLKYWLLCSSFQSELKCYGTGSTVEGIKASKLRLLSILLPPLKEQFCIVQYLNERAASIDKKILLLENKIFLYQELSKSIINEAVCRGLNKNVPLKDSAIEWIGEIPKHWQVKRLKDVGYLYSGLSGKTGEHFNQEVSDNSQHYIPFTNIANNRYINHEALHTVLMEENERQNKVKKNDLFFLMSSEGFADIGKSALLIEDVKDTYLNSFCKGYRITKKSVIPKYLNYLLNSPAFRDKFIVQGKGFTRINLKMEKVSDFEFVIPPVEEQTAIAEHLDKKTTTIDAIVDNIKLQIDNLKELRKTLINDVVTGKLKVTE